MSTIPANIMRTTCRVCGSSDLTPLFSLGNHWVSNFVARKDVLTGPRCPLELILCRNCSLVQLRHTAPQELLYRGHYHYRSGVTETMRAALRNLVEVASHRCLVNKGDTVLDIGSNDATLLREWPDTVVRVGVEPASNMRQYYDDSLYLCSDFWGAEGVAEDFIQCHGQAKIITAAGMLYDLEKPGDFVRDVARVLHPEGVFIAQLMCLRQMLEAGDVGNLVHEHLEYYSLKSLEYLFGQHGLEIYDLETNDVNGGSYRLYVRHKITGPKYGQQVYGSVDYAFLHESQMRLGDPATYAAFYGQLFSDRNKIRNFVESIRRNGKRPWIYGASTKGNTLLQWWGLPEDAIQYAAERSPEKIGKYTVGTGIEIRSEQAFREANPEYAILLPYTFEKEIVEREKVWLNRGGRFIVPLPRPHVISCSSDDRLNGLYTTEAL